MLVLDQVIVIDPCRWETYEALLDQDKERCRPRLAFSGGMLEIVSPSSEHEVLAEVLTALIQRACEHFEIPFCSLRSTTQRRKDLEKGAEPDVSFGFNDLGSERPDLVIEVEASRSALNKFELYAALGVTEFWRCSWNSIQIYRVEGGVFQAVDRSGFLPLAQGWLEVRLADKQALDWLSWFKQLRSELGEIQASG